VIEPLLNVLEAMVKDHQTLDTLAKEKTALIKSGDLQGLDKLLTKEDALAERIRQLEFQRQKCVSEITKRPDKDMTFSELIETVPESFRPELEEIQLRLTEVVVSLKYQNDLNQSLLQQSLDWVHLNMSLLQPQVKQVTYSNKNRNKNLTPDFAGSTSRFDSKA
jgi:flagellar biosynthesis/type III secretory pathway chaperone